MSDIDTDQRNTDQPNVDQGAAVPPASAPSAAPPARVPAARQSGGWGWILWLVVLAAAGYIFWRVQTVEQGQDRVAQDERTTVQKLRDQADVLQREGVTNRQDIGALRARLDDAAKVNESLRAQVLGLSERARLAEEAIANLADKRLSGHDSLLLNEAELLLVLGGERYRLFHDPAAAVAAYRLADAALAEANNAAFSTIRQSISAEVGALGALQTVDTAAIEEQLARTRAQLVQLPLAAATEKPAAATTSRWAQIFGEFVRVSRDDDTRELLARSDPLLARALIDAALRDAQAALLMRDDERFQRSLALARSHLAETFDTKAASVTAQLDSFDALGKLQLAAPAPDVLGAALKELRNLRKTEILQHDAPLPPAATPAPATAGEKT
jgi:uroporphyrin-III C-methyltransferase